ncbi:MAG: DEAD/DEAH box helicase [Bacteroidales bacterium]
MDGVTTDDPVILLISQHRQFGAIIAPWEVLHDQAGWYVLQNRLDWFPSAETEREPRGELNEIITISHSFSDTEIHRQFNRKKVSMKAFFAAIPEEMLLRHIRPFIDRRMDQILRLAVQHDISVFEHENSSRVYLKNRLLVSPDPSEPWFCFTKTAEGSNYVLELLQQDNKIKLKLPGNRLICRNPCWFLAENRLLHFPDGFDGKKIEPFLTKETILIPASAEKKYFETFILKTLKTGQVKASGFKIQSLDPDRRMELSAELDWQGNAVLVIYFRYGDNRIMAGKPQKVFIDLKMDDDEVVFYKTIRDPAWELDMRTGLEIKELTRVNESVLGLPGATGSGMAGMHRLVSWLNVNANYFAGEKIAIVVDKAPVSFFTGTVSSLIRVEPGEDWFDVKASVFFGDLEIPFLQLRQFILDGTREFPLPGGKIAILPAEWFARYGDLCYFSTVTDQHLRLPLHHVQLIRDLELPGDDHLTERLKQLDPGHALAVKVPDTLQAVLRPYQEDGLQWLGFLREHGFGGILADDMGLGKTIQALALLLSCHTGSNPASLIVMPASLIHNWRNEIRRFAPSLRVLEHTGTQRMNSTNFFGSVDVIITTYGTLRNDLDLFLRYRFFYVILDESQVIKNPSALTSRAVCQLKSENRLVLTGTPIENSLTDLWSQFEFLNPGLLGPLPKFQKRYLSARQAPLNSVSSIASEDPDREAAVAVSEHLKLLLSPFILRRTKKEAEPDLPALTIRELYCEMTDGQRSRYEQEKSAVRNDVFEQIESGRSSATSLLMLKALIRLRQMANHPALADPEYRDTSGKFDEIMRVAHVLREEGHKILLFSSFVKHLQLVAKQFDLDGISYSMLTGSTKNREPVIRKFQDDPACQFFLISLKAGGTGLNLTEAGYVMLLDPWWNPAAELQAINRAHRIGQEKKVIAYKFITSGTIEEKMLTLQERKQALSDNFLPAGNPLKDLSVEEIHQLFG